MDARDGRIEDVDRIRVLRIITRLNVGGPALHAALLTTRLDPQRFDTLLVAGREGSTEGSMIDLGRMPPALRARRVPALGRAISPTDDLRAFIELIRIIRQYRPHVVHTHLAKAGSIGRLAAWLARAPVIVHTYHGTVWQGYFGPIRSELFLTAERCLAKLSTRVIAITPSGRRELVDLRVAPRDKVELVPLGLDLAPFRTSMDRIATRRTLGITDEAVVAGIVGRLVPIKDVATFLRAIAAARVEIPHLVGLVVGDGSERPELEMLAGRLGLGASCRFLGFRADVAELFAAMDLLVLTSLNEGSPVAIIEGMAARKPVIVTAVGGVPDIVTDGVTGMIIPPQDPARIARAIVLLARDPALRARLGNAATAAVYPKYDVSRLARDVEALYIRLLAVTRG